MAAQGKIELLSARRDVSMSDEWYSLVDADHFWIKRRETILHRLVADLMREGRVYADVGCGRGLTQTALIARYGVKVHGFDLNMEALQSNVAGERLFYYDVTEGLPAFQKVYAGVFALDVLEHVGNEQIFLDALLGLVQDGGFVCINVPALQGMYSEYDRRVGHLRRYAIDDFRALAARVGFEILRWSYWGMPLLPLLLVRRLISPYWRGQEVLRRGVHPGGRIRNWALGAVSRLEWIPQHVLGTSLMLVMKAR